MDGHIIVFCLITKTEYIRGYSGILKIVSLLRIDGNAGRSLLNSSRNVMSLPVLFRNSPAI